MLPSKKQQLQHCCWRTTRELPVCGNVSSLSAAAKWKVLAERNQPVAPVGAWVESAPEDAEQEESLAFASAAVIEEEYKEQQKEKERALKRFQEEVKQRVNQHVKQRKKQQLQKSYEAALKEGSVVIGFSDSALQLTPKKSTCLFRRNTNSVICSSTGVQQLSNMQQGGEEMQDAQLLEQSQSVRKTVQQVRLRLASCKTVSEGEPSSELPGGSWGNHPSTQAKFNTTTAVKTGENHPREFPLVGYHDLPAELQEQEIQKREEGSKGCYCTIQLGKISSDIMRGSCSAATSAVGAETQATLVLWPGIEKEESKKERQNQYLRYRRLFMDIEREQVKEQQRQKEWQKKMDKIKKEKEHQRLAEEQRMQEATSHEVPNSSEKACEKLEQLKIEDVKEKKKIAKQQRHREYARYVEALRAQMEKKIKIYVEALRAQMEKKIKMYNISLPSLCFCGSDFWDCHPDSCANNCVFYKNHKAYAHALRSVISSCNVFDGGSDTRLAVHTFATVHARSDKNS
ncbi:PREDICTED: coiled-coil domain-containing protein 15 [Gekko japonicus]|uniref:Coiled-coil domain-containing protein 15 n=1 Tax=Gekko japonicus TaxID=146911 RepID=A0ABM1L592_GEKJA|nr:PREDICTED: coiled-coil domain-containing protein 15 [Gekko japonicus]